jgi:hypothetical protein
MAKWIIRDDLAQTDLAWSAGIVDGEGCITIYGRPGRVSRKGVRALALVLTVTNTDPRMLVKLKYMFGGNLKRSPERRISARRPCFTWLITGKPCARVLGLIYPYLVIKKEQADIGIAYGSTIGYGGPITADANEKRYELQGKIKGLKLVSWNEAPDVEALDK